MEKGFKTFLLMVAACAIFITCTSDLKASTKQITLFGSISSPHSIEDLVGLPVFYKGGEYTVAVDKESEIKKANFELYDEEKPRELYILVINAGDLKIPNDNHVEHLEIKPKTVYKLFKLSRFAVDLPEIDPLDLLNNKKLVDRYDSWKVEQVLLRESELVVPDNTVIIFVAPEFVEKLEVDQWLSNGTGMKLPRLVLKQSLTKDMIKTMCDTMVLGAINFRAFHKKPFKAIVPCAQNRLLSMPFTPRGYNC